METKTDELIIFPNVQMTKINLFIPEETTFTEWEDIGRKLKGIEGAVQFWIGDWINFGSRKYGDKYLIAMAKTGFTIKTLQSIAAVSRRFNGKSPAGGGFEGLAIRHENLSFAHHQEVAYLPPKVASSLLDEAEDGHWSKSELRGAVEIWREEHQPAKQPKHTEIVFSWFHDLDIEAMLDGMLTIRKGINKLMHDERDPEVRKDLLQKVDALMVDIDKDIKQYLARLK